MITKEQVRDYVVSRFSHLSPEPKEEQSRDLKKRIRKSISQYNVGEPSGHPGEGKVPKAKAGALLSAERRSADVGAGPRKVAG